MKEHPGLFDPGRAIGFVRVRVTRAKNPGIEMTAYQSAATVPRT